MIALFRYSFYEINVVFYRTYHVWVRTVRAPALDFQGVRVNFLRYSTGAVRTSSQHSPHARAVRSMVEHQINDQYAIAASCDVLCMQYVLEVRSCARPTCNLIESDVVNTLFGTRQAYYIQQGERQQLVAAGFVVRIRGHLLIRDSGADAFAFIESTESEGSDHLSRLYLMSMRILMSANLISDEYYLLNQQGLHGHIYS